MTKNRENRDKMTLFGVVISQEYFDWLGVSFTQDEFLDAVEEDVKNPKADALKPYKVEVLAKMRDTQRWVWTYRSRMGEPDFFTKTLPFLEQNMINYKENLNG
jgi:hypothetical protein